MYWIEENESVISVCSLYTETIGSLRVYLIEENESVRSVCSLYTETIGSLHVYWIDVNSRTYQCVHSIPRLLAVYMCIG